MDFALDELQTELATLAERILRRGASTARLAELEASGTRLDTTLWQELGSAGLTAVGVPASLGGAELGFFEHCLVLEQTGKTVAPVPLAAHGAGLMALHQAGLGDRSAVIVSGGGWLAATSRRDGGNTLRETDGLLRGGLGSLAWASGAAAYLLPARMESGSWGLFLVQSDAPGMTLDAQANTALEPAARLRVDGVPCVRVGDDAMPEWLHQRLVVASAAVQVGVLEEAISMTTRYVSEREQFGVKIGSFQSVSHRLADAWIDLMNLRLLARSTAATLDREPLATLDVLSTRLWCAEAGHRVMASCQHVHGGMGHDRSYPLWRYALLARQNEMAHGGHTACLAELGAEIARSPALAVL